MTMVCGQCAEQHNDQLAYQRQRQGIHRKPDVLRPEQGQEHVAEEGQIDVELAGYQKLSNQEKMHAEQ